MIICICNRVSDRDISRMARSGATFDELQLELGVATQCGCCEGCARQLHDSISAQCNKAHGHHAVALCSSASVMDRHAVINIQPA
jgi:bacterioferritin-associated ferredoxin